MKKLLALALVLAMMALPVTAFADDAGVQIISGDEEPSSNSFDDLKIDTEIEIDGYGVITPIKFQFIDSGETKYAYLSIDVLNTALVDKNFGAQCGVKAVYDDKYEYEGKLNSGNKSVAPLYVSHCIFEVILPKAAADGKGPLKMIITLDDYEFTYHIRK